MTLLVLRPQPGADRTVARAHALGFKASLYPLFAVAPLDWTGPDPASVDALLITSANAARHGGAGLARYQALPVYAVGDITAEALRDAGFALVTAGAGGVQDAIRLMEAHGHARILHLSGRDVRPYGMTMLAIARIPVYAAVEAGDSVGLAAALPAPDAILLVHSARAGARLAALVSLRDRVTLRLVAIGDAALQAAGTGWALGLAAPVPTDKAMLALAATLCD